MPIDSSHILSGLRPVGGLDARIVRTAAGDKEHGGNAPAASAAATFQPSAALDPGAAPVDAERVQVIRKAIEQGTYPVLPIKIADAMIAAGLLLRARA